MFCHAGLDPASSILLGTGFTLNTLKGTIGALRQPARLCRNYHFCHSVQAKRDTESSNLSKFWIPAYAGMTILIALSAIMTQSLRGNDIFISYF
jgi:hypothetical protein